jgi:hypothetical protein
MFLRILVCELHYFDFIGTRSSIAFCDAQSYTIGAAAYRSAFQGSQGALNWACGYGRARNRHRD